MRCSSGLCLQTALTFPTVSKASNVFKIKNLVKKLIEKYKTSCEDRTDVHFIRAHRNRQGFVWSVLVTKDIYNDESTLAHQRTQQKLRYFLVKTFKRITCYCNLEIRNSHALHYYDLSDGRFENVKKKAQPNSKFSILT